MIDIGANLLDPIFSHDIGRVLLRAQQQSGISSIFITGTNLEQSHAAIQLTKQFPQPLLKCTVGIHPTESLSIVTNKTWFDDLLKLASSGGGKHVVAIGECGLDRDRTHFAPFENQLSCFEPHFDACKILSLPMFIHSRNCPAEMIAMLTKRRNDLVKGGVVHSFTGTVEELKSYVDLDLFIGVNGCSFKTVENIKIIKQIPLDKLLIETDAPWCTIKPTMEGIASLGDQFRITKFEQPSKEIKKFDPVKPPQELDWVIKNRNEPRNLLNVLEVVAAVHEQDIDTMKKILFENTIKLFGSI
jgi:TatD DNase family protein